MFEIGDKVKIVGKKIDNSEFAWSDEMDKTIGTVGNISDRSVYGTYQVDNLWYYLPESFELVKDESVVICKHSTHDCPVYGNNAEDKPTTPSKAEEAANMVINADPELIKILCDKAIQKAFDKGDCKDEDDVRQGASDLIVYGFLSALQRTINSKEFSIEVSLKM